MISLAHMPRPGAAMESAPDAVCETLRCELPDGRVIIARIHTEEGEAEHRRAHAALLGSRARVQRLSAAVSGGGVRRGK